MDRNQAVTTERLGSVDRRLTTLEAQLRQLLYGRNLPVREETP